MDKLASEAQNNWDTKKIRAAGEARHLHLFWRGRASREARSPRPAPLAPLLPPRPRPSGAALRPCAGPGPHTASSVRPGAREGRGLPLNSQSLFPRPRPGIRTLPARRPRWLPGPSQPVPPRPRHPPPKASAVQVSENTRTHTPLEYSNASAKTTLLSSRLKIKKNLPHPKCNFF